MYEKFEIVSLISNPGQYYGLIRCCSYSMNDKNGKLDGEAFGYYLNDNYMNLQNGRETFLTILETYPLSRTISIDAKYLNDEDVMNILTTSPTLKEVRITNEGYYVTNEVLSKFPRDIRIVCDFAVIDIMEKDRVFLQSGLFKREINYIGDSLVAGYFINRELTDTEIELLVYYVNKDQEGDYRNISIRTYTPEKYRNILTKLHEYGLNDDVKIQVLGNPLYDKTEDYDGLDSISSNPVEVIYDTCSDMIDQYEAEPYTVSQSHHSELEGGGVASFASYYKMLQILEEHVSHIKEKGYSPLEAMIYAYRYLQKNHIYDPNYQETDEINPNLNRQLDLVIDRKTIVCLGYATLYSAIMRRCGIPLFRYTTDRHARNIGRLVDSKYDVDMIGVIDPTWDCSEIENGQIVESNSFMHFMISPRYIGHIDPFVTIPYSLVLDSDEQLKASGLDNKRYPFYSFFSKDPYEVYEDPTYSPEGYAITMLDLMGIKVPEPFDIDEYKKLLRDLNKTSIFDSIKSSTIGEAYREVMISEYPEMSDTEIERLVGEVVDSLESFLHYYPTTKKLVPFLKESGENLFGAEDVVPILYDNERTLDISYFNKPEKEKKIINLEESSVSSIQPYYDFSDEIEEVVAPVEEPIIPVESIVEMPVLVEEGEIIPVESADTVEWNHIFGYSAIDLDNLDEFMNVASADLKRYQKLEDEILLMEQELSHFGLSSNEYFLKSEKLRELKRTQKEQLQRVENLLELLLKEVDRKDQSDAISEELWYGVDSSKDLDNGFSL